MTAAIKTREPQYAPCFDEPPVVMGAMAGATWRWNPRRIVFASSRYKFVAQMLKGKELVAEIGCADGFLSEIVRREVWVLDLYDFDPVWASRVWDIVEAPLPRTYDAIFMLDVIEHIDPKKESLALANIKRSLRPHGTLIVGAPSLESQAYAADISKAGHVNCKSGEQFRADLQKHFGNVFLFGMNDEVLHTGFPQMCHYLLAVCTEAL